MSKPNFVQRAAIKFLSQWVSQSPQEFSDWMDSLISGGVSTAGPVVSRATASNFSAFYDGVLQICQTIASCPTILYKNMGDFAKKPWEIHPVSKLLLRKSNSLQNAFVWKERMQYYAMVYGNGYSYVQRDEGLRPVALWPLNPERTTPKIKENKDETTELVYEFRKQSGEIIEYPQSAIFHLCGFGFDSVKGYSLLEIARSAIGLGLSQQEFTGRFTSNGTHLGGVLLSKKELSDPARKRVREQFSQFHQGLENAGKFALLEEDMDFKTLGMPLADAQFLESKVFQISEIARFLNISPYKLKDYSKATFSNIEHLGIEYATDTIRPWAERWEAAINTQLLSEGDQIRGFAEFDLSAIQRGDVKTLSESLTSQRNGGFINGDEGRYKLGFNPVGGKAGSTFWMPKNMRDASLDEVAVGVVNAQPE